MDVPLVSCSPTAPRTALSPTPIGILSRAKLTSILPLDSPFARFGLMDSALLMRFGLMTTENGASLMTSVLPLNSSFLRFGLMNSAPLMAPSTRAPTAAATGLRVDVAGGGGGGGAGQRP